MTDFEVASRKLRFLACEVEADYPAAATYLREIADEAIGAGSEDERERDAIDLVVDIVGKRSQTAIRDDDRSWRGLLPWPHSRRTRELVAAHNVLHRMWVTAHQDSITALFGARPPWPLADDTREEAR